MVNCPNCATEIGENRFCTECGIKIEHVKDIPQENNQKVNCPKCSVQLPANTKFCTSCGTKIENLNVYKGLNQKIVCTKCSLENPAGTRFCTSCGTKLEQNLIYQDLNQEIVCPKCSAENPAGMKFCTSCGTKLGNITYSPNQEIICPKCSAELPAGTRFCTACGTKFKQISESQNDFISDDTVETVKETGKDIMKGVGGLFNKASSKGGLFDKVSAGIDDVVSPKTKTVYKRMLICQNCGSYYELEKGESPNDFSDECECGGKLKYQLKQEKIQINS